MTTPDATRPLGHVRVLDLSRMWPGAFCTLMLADLGADVLKVEAPGHGDGLRFVGEDTFLAVHVALNRGKRSMTLDIRKPGAPDLLRRLASDTDVIVESQRPGMLDELGIGFDDLRVDNPGLVWCSLSGFGPDSPNALAPGRDLTYAGYSGLLSQLTDADEPVVLSVPLTLQVTALMGALGIVSGLTHRDRTGVGSRVDVNMVDSSMWILAEQFARAANAPGEGWAAPIARRSNYCCADGRWITCTATEPTSWAKVVEALHVPELANLEPVVDESARVRLAEVFATKPRTHWLKHPGLAGGIGPVYAPADLLDDPQVTHRRGVVPLTGGGPLVFANPIRIDGVLGDQGSHALGLPPDLGEHTDAVLAAAGFSTAEIAALRDARVI